MTMNKYDKVIKALRICEHANECSAEKHYGCPYGDESIIECADLLEHDLRDIVNETCEKLGIEMLCCNCPHDGTEYCINNGCLFVNAASLLKVLCGEDITNEST